MLRAMRRPVVLFLIVHALLIKVAIAGGTGPEPILGGTPATVGQYPTVVAIQVGQGLCTGTLITKDWVLTAAHCVTPSVVGEPDQQSLTASIQVHFNTVNVFQNPGMVVTASDSIPDPGFNISDLGHNDSGLIKLSTPVTSVTPVPVNFIAADAPVGVMVTMVGFGATATGGGGSVGIEYVVQQMSQACSSGEGSDANLLCFSQLDGKGKCEGDSGGPSFAMVNGKLTEVGITSFGDTNCSVFGADTRTDAEKAFILQHVPELECSADTDCPMGDECFLHKCIVMPFKPTGLGSTCMDSSGCDSGMCGMGPGGGKCTMQCAAGSTDQCPAGFTCEAAGSQAVCWPTSHDSGGGCCDASGASGPTAIVGFGLIGLLLGRRRRA
jgi:uncharacterized protein (TIGR03382 family)